MKKIIVGLLVLGSISSFASNKNCNIFFHEDSVGIRKIETALIDLGYSIVYHKDDADFSVLSEKYYSRNRSTQKLVAKLKIWDLKTKENVYFNLNTTGLFFNMNPIVKHLSKRFPKCST
jgi:hypothetical protein